MTAPPTSDTSTPPVLQARGLVKTFGRVVGLDGVDLELLPRRGAGDHRRQRRRQIDADQVPHRAPRSPTRARSSSTGKPVLVQAPAGRPRRRHRDRLPEPGGLAGARHRQQPLPRPRGAAAGLLGSVFRMLDRRACATGAKQQMTDLGISTLQDDDPGRREPVRRPAPGRRRRPRRGVRLQGRHPRRADRGARRTRVGPGARARPATCATGACRSSSSATTCRRCSRSPTASTSSGSGKRAAIITPKTHTPTDAVAIMTGAMVVT